MVKGGVIDESVAVPAREPDGAAVGAEGLVDALAGPPPSLGAAVLAGLRAPVDAVAHDVRIDAVEAVPGSGPTFTVLYRVSSVGLNEAELNGLISGLAGQITKHIREKSEK